MLIAMAVWDTFENMRTEQTLRTLQSLAKTVDWNKHRLIVSDNGSCENTQGVYRVMAEQMPLAVIQNGENLGTARAINRAWSFRNPREHVVKMDNDVVINHIGWADEIEEVFARDPSIGICGLKRKDLAECPWSDVDHYKSQLYMLTHNPGESWIVVEECQHIMGTCQAFNSTLFEAIGYLYQGDWKYGFDDSLASLRSRLAGFKNVFLPHINIDHIDPGQTQYTEQKKIDAGIQMNRYGQIVDQYVNGGKSLFYDGGEDGVYSQG